MTLDRFQERRLLTLPEGLHAVTPTGTPCISISSDSKQAACFASVIPYEGPVKAVQEGRLSEAFERLDRLRFWGTVPSYKVVWLAVWK